MSADQENLLQTLITCTPSEVECSNSRFQTMLGVVDEENVIKFNDKYLETVLFKCHIGPPMVVFTCFIGPSSYS